MIDKQARRPHFIVMQKVEIYTKFMCPYCSRAMALLRRKNVTIEEHDITMGGPDRAVMLERSGGRSTVPQIFIGERHVGGSDDLAVLEQSGELDTLLAA